MSAKIGTLGILAGEGEIPHMLINHGMEQDIPFSAVQFDGCTYSGFPRIRTLQTRIERVGDIFKFLKSNKATDVVLIGNLSKPSLSSLRPDLKGIKTLAKIGKSYMMGDDNLLRSLRKEIETEGFTVRGADYFLPDLTMPAGVHTVQTPTMDYSAGLQQSIQHGIEDKGQSVLMHVDGTYSFETRSGTTALVEQEGRAGSILIKTVKPQQDPDLDRPTVGIETLKALHKVGGAGLVIQADAVFAIHQEIMVKYANEHDLFIEAVHV